MNAYYNEIDPFAAATLRELIAEGLIAPGEVDERDIRDVQPAELAGFTQHHFFAGGGIWSYALRRAGWPDWLPIWTCSCPCQPFSAAGKGAGFDDERHLWPAFYWLQSQLRPECILGEQVTGGDADAWLDLVQADVEALDYAFGCVPLASAGFGAPNPRHRAFWVAYANGAGLEGRLQLPECADQLAIGPRGVANRLGNAVCDGAEPITRDGDRSQGTAVGIDGDFPRAGASAGEPSAIGGMEHSDRQRRGEARTAGAGERPAERGNPIGLADALRAGRPERRAFTGNGQVAGSGVDGDGNPGPVNGFWRNADWLYCRDPRGPRWRPVDGGTFPLAPGHPARVGTLCISGNAINAEVATGFIEAVIAHLATPATELAA